MGYISDKFSFLKLHISVAKLHFTITYGSVSVGRGKWPFRVIFFFSKVERSCGQTVKDRHDFSIDPGQVGLGNPKNTLTWP